MDSVHMGRFGRMTQMTESTFLHTSQNKSKNSTEKSTTNYPKN